MVIEISIISEKDIRSSLSLDDSVISTIEAAFLKLGNAHVVMPPVMQINVDDAHGQTCVKSAYIPGDDSFAVKLASTYHNNVSLGLPNSSGLMVICSARTGHAECILLDNGYLTALRTAAAGAVAAKYLSRPDSKVVGVIGAGRQGRLQLEAICMVRKISSAVVWSPRADESVAFASEMSKKLSIDVKAADNAETLVRVSDIVVTATPARSPIISSKWLHSGLHITAMGADAPGKSELKPEVLPNVDLYVSDYVEQCKTLSEFHAAIMAGTVSADYPAVELADVITGNHAGRCSEAEITVADLTGLGVQDTAIALLARDRVSALSSIVTA